uniref:hypothetical protein n=1 Tax=Methylobacterium sp. B34 TaxID=95563 RepID=UPI0019553A82
PGITGVCFEPLTFVIGTRFRSFFAEVSGTELAVSPPENHSEQERLSNLSESRTESSVPDSRRDSRDSLSVSSFLSALTASIRTKTGINNRNPSPSKAAVDVDAQIHAELALLREAQAQRKAKAAEVRAGGLTPSLFNHASTRLR